MDCAVGKCQNKMTMISLYRKVRLEKAGAIYFARQLDSLYENYEKC